MSMALFSIQAVSAGFGGFGWMLAARRIAPPRLLALAGLTQLSLFAPILARAYLGDQRLACAVAVLHGIASGAVEPVFVGFNFVDRWASTTALTATRLAMSEPMRLFVNLATLA
eukprot:4333615-Prymnesium_polylepis.1